MTALFRLSLLQSGLRHCTSHPQPGALAGISPPPFNTNLQRTVKARMEEVEEP